MDVEEFVRFQIEHSVWALGRLIEHARRLPGDSINQDMGIGPGSLRENLAHTIEAMFYFADNFAGRAYVERAGFADHSRTPDGLALLLVDAHRDLNAAMLAAVTAGPRSRVGWPNAETGSLPAAAAIAQVFDHAVLHRTQAVNMLKRLNVRPVPDLDPMTFQATGHRW
jgi:uncharacterized damage-inducible protein DinB